MGALEPAEVRRRYARALAVNAVADSFNVALLAAILIAGLIFDAFLLALPVALVVYAVAVTRTFFDEDAANKVLERERARRQARLEAVPARLDPATLAPEIAQLVLAAREREARIRAAIERAELPYAEVSEEVDRFVRAMDQTAARAQLLAEALHDTPPEAVERRLAQVRRERSPGRAELIDALEQQLAVQRRMQTQLQRFSDEMERMLVELDTVRGNLVSVSASTEAANQVRLAADVRALREEMGALAEGMRETFE